MSNRTVTHAKAPTPAPHTPVIHPAVKPLAPVPVSDAALPTVETQLATATRLGYHFGPLALGPGTPTVLQPKLRLGPVNDPYEQEADRTAAAVVQRLNAPGAPVQRQPESEEDEAIQPKRLLQRQSTLEDEDKLQRQAAPEEDEELVQPKALLQQQTAPEDEEELQRQVAPEEEEEVQTKALIQRQPMPEEDDEPIQRQSAPEEDDELVQTQSLLQRQTMPEEEEEIQTKALIQRQPMPEDEEPIQRQATPEAEDEPLQAKSLLQRQAEPSKDDEELQRAPAIQAVRPSGGTDTVDPALEASIRSARGGGQPLAAAVRRPLEQHFGADFSQVKIHSDARADTLNRSLQARAFTTGQDLFFRQGEYNPQSTLGQQLIAHELTHVIQQGGSPLVQPVQAKGLHSGQPLIQRRIAPLPGTADQVASPATAEGEPSILPTPEERAKTQAKVAAAQAAQAQTQNQVADEMLADSAVSEAETPTQSREAKAADTPAALPSSTGSETATKAVDGTASAAQGDKAGTTATTTTTTSQELGPASARISAEAAPVNTRLSDEVTAQTDGSAPMASQQPGVDAGVGSPEYQVFLQQVQSVRKGLRQTSSDRKKHISDGADAEKQNINQLVEAEAVRLEGSYNQAVDAVRSAIANAQIEIDANKTAKVKSTSTVAQTELDRLDNIEREKKGAMQRVGNEKADAAMAIGEREAKRAINGSGSHVARALQIKQEKIAELRNVKDGERLATDVEERVANIVREFTKAGGDLAAMARARASEAAQHIKTETAELVTKMSQPTTDARTEIVKCRDATINSIQDQAQTSLTNLQKESNEIITKLHSDKQAKCAQVRANAKVISQAVDISVSQAHQKVDSETIRISEEITHFVIQIAEVNWAGPQLESAGPDLTNAVTNHNTEQDSFATNVVAGVKTGITNAVTNLGEVVTDQGEAVTTIGTDFETKTSEASTQVTENLEDARKKGADKIAEPTKQVEEKLQRGVQRAGEEWDRQLKVVENDISHDVNDSLRKQDDAIATLDSSLDGIGSKARSFVSSIIEAIVDFGSFIGGVVMGLLGLVWDLLKDLWDLVKKPLFWIVVAIVVVLIIAFFGWEALVAALAKIVWVLVWGGIILGVGSAIYYIYLAVTKPDLSPYERGKLVGKAIGEIILAFLGTGVWSKLGAWIARVSRIAAFLDKVGDIVKATRLLRRVHDIEVAIRLIDEIKDAGIVLRLIDEIDDVETVLKLWRAVGNADDILRLWAEIKNAENIIKLWTEIKDVETVLKLWHAVGNADDILRLWAEIKNAENIIKLWTEIKDVDKIRKLWATVKDADAILKLWAKTQDVDLIIKLWDKLPDVAQIERLFGITDNAAQLERFFTQVADPVQIERLINKVGLGPTPGSASSRLDQVLQQMGPGKHNAADIEAALDAQKALDDKILVGEPKATPPPGTPPTGPAREIRGGHSPRILTEPDFQIVSQAANADRTINARFKKIVSPGPPPVWSTNKSSTLAPSTWSDADILRAGEQVANTPVVLNRARDGATLHRGMINGVQWEVIKDASGRMTSSYPTGGVPTTSF